MEGCKSDVNVNEVNGPSEFTSESQDDTYFYNLRQSRDAAICTLALWSNPAWIVMDTKAFHLTAISQWVFYHRMCMAMDRSTVAEIIGGVKGVIPNSRLAVYGDYKYDLDLEDMYDILEDNLEQSGDGRFYTSKYPAIENPSYGNTLDGKTCYSQSGCKEYHVPQCDDSNFDNEMKTTENDKIYSKEGSTCSTDPTHDSIRRWVSKWRNLLAYVREVINMRTKCNAWTDILLKTCLKFLSALKCNKSLMQLMETEISFIANYHQLYADPISTVELLSIPQPIMEDNLHLDTKQTDVLWLKLSSPHIRQIWKGHNNCYLKEKIVSRDSDFFENTFDPSLGSTNFLRRQRPKNASDILAEEIEISEIKAKELLGSLLNLMNGNKIETSEPATNSSTKTFFPEAHGEWTKSLFQHQKPILSELDERLPNNRFNDLGNQFAAQNFPPGGTRFQFGPFPINLSVPPPPICPSLMQIRSNQIPPHLLSISQQQARMLTPPNLSSAWNFANNSFQQTFMTQPNMPFYAMRPAIFPDPHVSPLIRNVSYRMEPSSELLHRTSTSPQVPHKVMVMQSGQKHHFPFATYLNKDTLQPNESWKVQKIKSTVFQNVTHSFSTESQSTYFFHLGSQKKEHMETIMYSASNFNQTSVLNMQNMLPQFIIPHVDTIPKKPHMMYPGHVQMGEINLSKLNTGNSVVNLQYCMPPPVVKGPNDFPTAITPSHSFFHQEDFSLNCYNEKVYSPNLLMKLTKLQLTQQWIKSSDFGAQNANLETTYDLRINQDDHIDNKRLEHIHFNNARNSICEKSLKNLEINQKTGQKPKVLYADDLSTSPSKHFSAVQDEFKSVNAFKALHKIAIVRLKKKRFRQAKMNFGHNKNQTNSTTFCAGDYNTLGKYYIIKCIKKCLKPHKCSHGNPNEMFDLAQNYNDKNLFSNISTDDNNMDIQTSPKVFFESFKEKTKHIENHIGNASSPKHVDKADKVKKPISMNVKEKFKKSTRQMDTNTYFSECNKDASDPFPLFLKKSPNGKHEVDNRTIAKYFTLVADSLIFDKYFNAIDGYHLSKSANTSNGRVDGWTHFKIAIQEVLRNATNQLLNDNLV